MSVNNANAAPATAATIAVMIASFFCFGVKCNLDMVFILNLQCGNDKSSATRRTGRNNCNRDAPAGFAVRRGVWF